MSENTAGFSEQFYAAYAEQQLIVKARQGDLQEAVHADQPFFSLMAIAEHLVDAKQQLEDFRNALRVEALSEATEGI